MNEEQMREEFETEFALPPYEWEFDRFGIYDSWPDDYRAYFVQCAWEGYQVACALRQKEINDLREVIKTNSLYSLEKDEFICDLSNTIKKMTTAQKE